MLEATIRIDTQQRDLLYPYLIHFAEALETFDDPERAWIGRAVLEALGPEPDGVQAIYELPRSPEIRAFLIEVRDTEWSNVDGGGSIAPQRSADALATASRLLLEFAPPAVA
jgi:hypothetical protein